MRTFLPAIWPAFFIRVSPASRNAKPACMNMTSTAVTTTQMVDAAISRSWFLGIDLRLLQGLARSVMRDVADGARPDDPVARLVAAACRVGNRVHHRVGDRVVNDEREHRLRQEARLEDPAAVLVGDAALAPMADRLDDRDPDVPGLVLDRVDHGLDPLADHHRLHLDHSPLLALDHKKSPQGSKSPEGIYANPAALRCAGDSATYRSARMDAMAGAGRPPSTRVPRACGAMETGRRRRSRAGGRRPARSARSRSRSAAAGPPRERVSRRSAQLSEALGISRPTRAGGGAVARRGTAGEFGREPRRALAAQPRADGEGRGRGQADALRPRGDRGRDRLAPATAAPRGRWRRSRRTFARQR